MFERFTQDARELVHDARWQAQELGHRHVGTEHLLLALLDDEPEDGLLHGLGVDKAAVEHSVRAALERIAQS